MFLLTIDAGQPTTSTHPDWLTAHRALLDYAVDADIYLEALQSSRPHTSYQLVKLVAAQARPSGTRNVGLATIEHCCPSAVPIPPRAVAQAAVTWIAEHSHAHPALRAAADNQTAAVLHEAADLAGVAAAPTIDPCLLDALQQQARRHRAMPEATTIARVVAQHLPEASGHAIVATVIWWYALIAWAVHTS